MLTYRHSTPNLIYASRANENKKNVDALVGCGLAYHSTREFVRMVKILVIKDTVWQFLERMQKSDSPMPRDVLVQRCLTDRVGTLT